MSTSDIHIKNIISGQKCFWLIKTDPNSTKPEIIGFATTQPARFATSSDCSHTEAISS